MQEYLAMAPRMSEGRDGLRGAAVHHRLFSS
jgi:hypothetical protein